MITFDNSFFYKKNGFNISDNQYYKKYLDISHEKSLKILEKFNKGDNEILQSFTQKYQKKIRNIKETLDTNSKKKVVVGLGGSSSGAKALSFYLEDNIIYFDNLDYQYLKNFFVSKNFKDYFFFIISKSGNTFETLALLNLLVHESRKIKNYNIYDSMVIITENKESILKSYADKNKIKFVEHNDRIGGRFSILSETGMLPFLDNNIIVENSSEKFINFLKDKDHDKSPVKNCAILLTLLNQRKLNIYCNLLYNYRLKHFSYWFHQLHAESLGKNDLGMTPITSVCPKDHHSMMQLYLDGPKDKFFNIFSPPDEDFYDKFIDEGFYNIESYSPKSLLDKQYASVIEVFNEKQIPHRVIKIEDHKDPLNLIELFAYFILETILLGEVLGINPYDQPAVNLIKDKIFKN